LFEILDLCVNYNVYEAGDIVEYNSVTYIANFQNQDLIPLDNSGIGEAWSIYTV